MPNLENAKKAMRVSLRKKSLNDKRRRAMKEIVKDAKIVANVEKKVVAGKLSTAYQAIDKALKRGVIKKNTAARKKSRLAKFIKNATK